jgi:hypothetical protein
LSIGFAGENHIHICFPFNFNQRKISVLVESFQVAGQILSVLDYRNNFSFSHGYVVKLKQDTYPYNSKLIFDWMLNPEGFQEGTAVAFFEELCFDN